MGSRLAAAAAAAGDVLDAISDNFAPYPEGRELIAQLSHAVRGWS
jgi:hypothetical protein